MLPPKVKVLRDGATDEVMATNIVPGDIVFVEAGDLIPADFRILECSDNFQGNVIFDVVTALSLT